MSRDEIAARLFVRYCTIGGDSGDFEIDAAEAASIAFVEADVFEAERLRQTRALAPKPGKKRGAW